jgi:Tfp pilus assembly protein PilV
MKIPLTHFRNACRGESLIEVMLAVVLTAVTALGLIAAQMWMIRDARATAMREHAALIADALVEVMVKPSQSDGAVSGAGDRTSVARVTWHTLAVAPRSGDVIDIPPPCGDIAVPVGTGCVVLAFAQ